MVKINEREREILERAMDTLYILGARTPSKREENILINLADKIDQFLEDNPKEEGEDDD